MDRLIYTAMSGLRESMVQQQAIANNMANAQTTGFRAEMVYATPVTITGEGALVRAMADGQVHGADMQGGAITRTAQPLDIAMTGDTMLAVQAPDGSEVYTRRGDLSISPTGVLQNGDGLPVIGSGGPITVPLSARLTIGADGKVLASDPAAPEEPPQPLDQLKLVSTAGSRIGKTVSGQFAVIGGGALPADADAKLLPGALEQSNVDPSAILVGMVDAQRLFDMRTRMVSTAKDIDESGASLMRLSAS